MPRPLEAFTKRTKASWLTLFLTAPVKALAKSIYRRRQLDGHCNAGSPVRVVCTSDTHNTRPALPEGDILVHAGDLTQKGTLEELQNALRWLNRQPHKFILVVAGNHDLLLDRSYRDKPEHVKQRYSLDWGRVSYLQSGSTILRLTNGRLLRVFGTPWTRKGGNWAFQYPKQPIPLSNNNAADHFGKIPVDTDILISHMPPRFHLDVDGWGSEELLAVIKRVKPLLHVFGHIHAGYGTAVMGFDAFDSAYERVCRGVGGLQDLLSMIRYHLKGDVSHPPQQRTVLVNPSATGGRRIDNQRPIVVEL